MRIIGIDPGLQRTGWGIIDVQGNKLTHISHSVIKTDPKAPTAERLLKIFRRTDAANDDLAAAGSGD